jgi:hypothetical protein
MKREARSVCVASEPGTSQAQDREAFECQTENEEWCAGFPTIEELFADVWGNPNPSVDQTVYETQEIYRGFDDELHTIEVEYCDRFSQDLIRTGWDNTAYAGYFCGIAIIVWIRNGYYNPYDIYFDGAKYKYSTVSPDEGTN